MIDYKKLYDDLINKARDRGDISGYTEKHHIIPRCLGGTDDEDNIVALTVEEHITAHIYLSNIHKDVPGLILAIQMMIPSRVSLNLIPEDLFSNREYKLMHQNRKVDVENSEERRLWKEKLSKITKNLMSDSSKRLRISNTLKNKKDKSNLKQRSRKVKDKFGNVFNSVRDCAKYYDFKSGVSISTKIKNNTGDFEYIDDPVTVRNKIIKGPNGTIYNSLRECSEKTGHSRKALRNWIKNYPEKGYSYIN